MYSKFRELLEGAEGHNDWVVAINADIRGFSTIMSGDPAQTTLYLRAVYGQILDNYFAGRAFFKPTGDGLLVIVPFRQTEEELAAITRSVVDEALDLHDTFAQMVKDNKLLQFPHPTEIGIGLASGSVSRLMSKKLVLDYAGRSLNLATRLMDLARPSGVVFDSSLDFAALSKKIRERFRGDHVYVKGVADEDGVDIFYTDPPIQIPERYRRPIRQAVRFEEKPRAYTPADLKKRTQRFAITLGHEPYDRSTIEFLVGFNVPPKQQRWWSPDFEYELVRGRPAIVFNCHEIAADLERAGVGPRSKATFEVAYMVDPGIVGKGTTS